jgi:NitT/TauT family transport system substrate-binding protein
VRTAFLNDHPDVVAQLLEGQIRANDYLRTNADDAKLVVDRGIEKLTGKPLTAKVINAAWKNLTFTNDPIASSLKGSADHAVDVGLLSPVDNLKGIYDLRILNKLLKAVGEPPVDGL